MLTITSDPESAIEHSRKALASNPGYTDAWLWLAQALQALGRLEETATTIRQMLVMDPLSIVGRGIYVPFLAGTGRIGQPGMVT